MAWLLFPLDLLFRKSFDFVDEDGVCLGFEGAGDFYFLAGTFFRQVLVVQLVDVGFGLQDEFAAAL